MLASIKPEGILCCINSRCLWVLIDLHNSAMSLRKQLPSFFEYPPCVSTYLWIDPSIHPSIQTSICHICPIYLCFLSIYASYPYKCVCIYIYMCTYICAHIYIYVLAKMWAFVNGKCQLLVCQCSNFCLRKLWLSSLRTNRSPATICRYRYLGHLGVQFQLYIYKQFYTHK